MCGVVLKESSVTNIEKVLYRGTSTAVGGREGSAESSDGALKVKLSTPKELGGGGGPGTNPEQMFAAGYAACFIGALQFVAGQQKVHLKDPKITATVGIGPIPGGFGIEAELQISLPGIEKQTAQAMVDKAHQVCPYSNATRGNINVKLKVV
jgi:lipoyl-dependent peroxiredoxin